MKVSHHASKRQGAASHNDRNFDLSKAPHIDPTKTHENSYWCWKEGMEFEKAELLFYKKNYTEMAKAQSKYRKVKREVEEYLDLPRYKPEELILQIGNVKDQPDDPEIFKECFYDYIEFLDGWNQTHGSHLHLLDYSVHKDEATPHAHVRMVWDYRDKDGILRISRNMALKQAGVGLFDPNQPESRTNTRKKAFDTMCRKRWIQICRDKGLQIEDKEMDELPDPDMETAAAKEKHKTMPDYKRDIILGEIEEMRSGTRKISGIINDTMTEIPPEKLHADRDGNVFVHLTNAEYESLSQKANAIHRNKEKRKSYQKEISESAKKTEEYKTQQKTFAGYLSNVKSERESLLKEAMEQYSPDELADVIQLGEKAIQEHPESMQRIMADFYHTAITTPAETGRARVLEREEEEERGEE